VYRVSSPYKIESLTEGHKGQTELKKIGDLSPEASDFTGL